MKFLLVRMMALLLLSTAALHAAPTVMIRSEATPKEIYIGDPIQYRVTVTFSSDVAPGVINIDKTLGSFEILKFISSDPETLADGKRSMHHDFLLTTFSTGAQTIPSLQLPFMATDGNQAQAKTEEMPIQVKSLLQEKGDMGGLAPLKGLFNFRSYLWVWILIGVIVAGLIVFALWKWRQSQIPAELLSKKPPKPAEQVAWEALHALEDSDLIAQGQFKEFYYQLSTILRQYLENRYFISALDKTTSELLIEFRTLSLSSEWNSLLRQFLEMADLVKFAKFTPNPEDIANDVARIKRFVNETTPQSAEDTNKKNEDALPI